MKFTAKEILYSAEMHTCKNCGHVFKGKICNQCGEKVFSEKQLTTRHFFHQVVDFFYHWESKVLKTIKLNIFKPGFITRENLRGVRVPYAKPVQLYLVVAFAFYLIVGKTAVRDYIPTHEDHNYYGLSGYAVLKWTKPADEWIIKKIDGMWERKGEHLLHDLQKINNNKYVASGYLSLVREQTVVNDSLIIKTDKTPNTLYKQMALVRLALFEHSIATLAKSMIFLLIPFIGIIFYLFFYKKIRYYGSALVFATHFMIYNLCFYSIMSLINVLPYYFGKAYGYLFIKGLDVVFYNKYVTPISDFFFNSSFELYHFIFWMPWLYIAFRRLFNTVWWKNILISYFCSRIFFYLIFGVLKKVLIAFTIWNLHL